MTTRKPPEPSMVIKHQLKSSAPDDVRKRAIHYHDAKRKHSVEAGELSASLDALPTSTVSALLSQQGGRSLGGKNAAKNRREKAKALHDRAVQLWDESHHPVRARASIIARRLGRESDTIRKIVRSAKKAGSL